MFRRRSDLPGELVSAWQAFESAALRIETGRRLLLDTLPVGRIELAPIAIGVRALVDAIDDAEKLLDEHRNLPSPDAWQDCRDSLAEAREAASEVEEVAATTSELEELLESVSEIVDPLDAYADAEREWHKTWRIPRELLSDVRV